MLESNNKFTLEDIEIMIESIGEWEESGNGDYNFLKLIKNAPLPSEDHEKFDEIIKIKNYFKNFEKEILQNRNNRQEKAIFLKAKIIMARNSGIMEVENSNKNKESFNSIKKKLKLTEEFISDLGVQKHYEKFLKETEQNTNNDLDFNI
jgi:hypothetical protein